MSNPGGNPTGLTTNLESINELLSSLNLDREKFVRNFREFERRRRTTISANKDVLRELKGDEWLNRCIKARNVGSAIGVLGALVAGTGYLLSFNDSTRKLGEELTRWGSTVGGVGGAGALALAVAEDRLSKPVLDKARAALTEDLKMTKELFDGLQRSEDLDSLFKKVFNTSVLSDSIIFFFTVVDEIKVICEEGAYTYKCLADVLRTRHNRSSPSSGCIEGHSFGSILQRIEQGRLDEKITLLLLEFCENPTVQASILRITNSLKRPFTFEFIAVNLRAALDMKQMLQNRVFLNLLSIATEYVNQGLYHAVNIGINVLDIISVVNNIKNEESKYSKMIEDVNKLLSLELEDMKRAYLSIVLLH